MDRAGAAAARETSSGGMTVPPVFVESMQTFKVLKTEPSSSRAAAAR
jgi:hypothetical protein